MEVRPGRNRQERGGKREQRARPTHFVALEIDDPTTVAALTTAQDELAAGDAGDHGRIGAGKLHFTLALLRLGQSEVDDGARAVAALRRMAEVMPEFEVELRGVDSFNGGRVVFAKAGEGEEELRELAGAIEEAMEGTGLLHKEERAFAAHCTLFKGQQRRQPPPSMQAVVFGRQRVGQVVVLAMGGREEHYRRVGEEVRLLRSSCGPEGKVLEGCVELEQLCFPKEEAADKSSMERRSREAGELFEVWQEEGRVVALLNGTASRLPVLTHAAMDQHHPDGSLLCLHSVSVHPDRRRRRLASRLLRRYLHRVRRLERFQRVALICKQSLVPFYQAAGFRCLGPSQVVHGPDPWFDCIIDWTTE